MSGDAGKDVGEPDLRIDAVNFDRDDQPVHGRSTPATAIRAAEQPSFSAKRDASQAALV
jgi:hypothetical protein